MDQHGKPAQYGAALLLCKKPYTLKPPKLLAARCGLFAGKARKKSDAKRFYNKTDSTGKKMIRTICRNSRIDVEK